MSRKRKEMQAPVEVEEPVVVAEEAYIEPAPVAEVSAVNVDGLKALLWKNDLEAMQEAAAKVQGDELTMRAVQGVLNAKGTGIAAQYLQQIIQRLNG